MTKIFDSHRALFRNADWDFVWDSYIRALRTEDQATRSRTIHWRSKRSAQSMVRAAAERLRAMDPEICRVAGI